MGWVVKQWRLDAIEDLLADAARADLAAARAAAARDARRARRIAHRTAAAADEQLATLERLGVDLRAGVRDWQAWRRLPHGPEAPVPTSAGSPRLRPARSRRAARPGGAAAAAPPASPVPPPAAGRRRPLPRGGARRARACTAARSRSSSARRRSPDRAQGSAPDAAPRRAAPGRRTLEEGLWPPGRTGRRVDGRRRTGPGRGDNLLPRPSDVKPLFGANLANAPHG